MNTNRELVHKGDSVFCTGISASPSVKNLLVEMGIWISGLSGAKIWASVDGSGLKA